MKKFYMVLVDGTGFKSESYEVFQEARNAAMRACISNGRRAYVMECLEGYKPAVDVIDIEE